MLPTIRWELRAARAVDFLADVGDEYTDIRDDLDWWLLDLASKPVPIDDDYEIFVHQYPVQNDADVLIYWRYVDENMISVFFVRLDEEDDEFNGLLQRAAQG